ncbi:transposase [Alkalihalophilus marmarensis]|uniref:transposase n=1 Tax=Alkalihalophilus marmarensis TaxID=521377 RepID=UPI003B75C97A
MHIFKYLLLKTIFNLSNINIIKHSKYNISFKYFLNLTPKTNIINPNSLTKFHKLHLPNKNLLNILIKKNIKITIKHNILKNPTIILNTTHTKTYFNKKSPKKFLQKKSKNIQKTIYHINKSIQKKFPNKPLSNNLQKKLKYYQQIISTIKNSKNIKIPTIKKKLNILKKIIKNYKKNIIQSNNPNTQTKFKSQNTSFFKYKSHLTITNKKQIITTTIITSNKKNNKKYLKKLINKTKNTNININTIITNTTYSKKKNIHFTNKHKIKLISKLHPLITNKSHKNNKFKFNKNTNTYIYKTKHLTIQKKYNNYTKHNKNPKYHYFFNIKKYKIYPLKKKYYKKKTKTKSYYITIKSTKHTKQKTFQKTKKFKKLSKSQYKIKTKNNKLKNQHKYKKTNYSNLFNIQIQTTTTIFTINLKKILKLKNQKKS